MRRAGALQGQSPEKGFSVRSDESTMIRLEIDNEQLICRIGIAPVKPAEIVIIRLQQETLDTDSA